MSKDQTHTGLLNTQSNAGVPHKEDYLERNREELQLNEEYTNGIWVRGSEGKYFGTMGDRIITKDYETLGELKQAIKNKEWDIIVNVVLHIMTTVKRVEEEEILKALEVTRDENRHG